MGKMSRNKGAAGERELMHILTNELGVVVKRNFAQASEGGHDLRGLPVALEVKRCEVLKLPIWWRQTLEQAEKAEKTPCLAYRKSHAQWQFVLPAFKLPSWQDSAGFELENWMLDYGHTATLQLDGFITLIREMITTTHTRGH